MINILKKNCASCNKKNLFLLLNLGNTPLANSFLISKNQLRSEKNYPLKLYFCNSCYLVQVIHNVKPSEFFVNYDYLSGPSTTWQNHCKKFTKKMISRFKLKKNKGEIIEIASNDGVLIENFKKKNFKCIGIEPSKKAHNLAKKKGVFSINKFLNSSLVYKEKKLKNSYPQLIIANNVIAHVKNINDFIKSIRDLSNNKTIISVEFPYVYNLLKNNQFDTIYHEHHYYYSITSLKNLIEKHDLEIFDAEYLKIHGGSYRVFIKKKNSSLKIKSKINKILDYENKINLNKKTFYKNFQNKVDKIKINTNNKLKKILKKNKVVHAYGAAAKGNTFLNFCKINDKQINIIYDANKKKTNKFLPGSHIKILDPSKIKIFKPDFIVVLPWNIFDEIKQQLSFTKKWGCKLITFKY